MTDNERDLVPRVEIVVIGILRISECIEMRCVREPWGWRPDIVVDHDMETVGPPPLCFELNDEALGLLDRALYAFGKDYEDGKETGDESRA